MFQGQKYAAGMKTVFLTNQERQLLIAFITDFAIAHSNPEIQKTPSDHVQAELETLVLGLARKLY